MTEERKLMDRLEKLAKVEGERESKGRQKPTENSFEGWSRVIKNISMETREPMWDQAIKYLIAECAMEPTMYDTLTSGQIAGMMRSEGYSICGTIIDFGIWVKKNQVRLMERHGDFMNEIWLAYLMETRYAMEWDGAKWTGVTSDG